MRLPRSAARPPHVVRRSAHWPLSTSFLRPFAHPPLTADPVTMQPPRMTCRSNTLTRLVWQAVAQFRSPSHPLRPAPVTRPGAARRSRPLRPRACVPPTSAATVGCPEALEGSAPSDEASLASWPTTSVARRLEVAAALRECALVVLQPSCILPATVPRPSRSRPAAVPPPSGSRPLTCSRPAAVP